MGFFDFLDRHYWIVTAWIVVIAFCFVMYLFEKNSRGGGGGKP